MYESIQGITHREKDAKDFPNNYKELQGEKQTAVGKPWKTEWLLSEYTKCTDGLIGRMDGTIPLKQKEIYVLVDNRLKEERRDLPPPSDVIYLDKSARPVEWLVKELWPLLARIPGTSYTEDHIPIKPHEHFLNIDKADWLRQMSIPEHEIEDAPIERIDLDHVDHQYLHEYLTRLRALYSLDRIEESDLGSITSSQNDENSIWRRPTIFDGKHVMLIDEVKSSGQSLRIAQMLLSMAIPDAIFSGEHWAKPAHVLLNKGIPDSDGKLAYKMAWVPVWYTKDDSSGRGISDRDYRWPEAIAERNPTYPITRVSQVGKGILSTPSHDSEYNLITDKKAQNLRGDIKELANDIRNKNILYRPDPSRKDAKDRIFAINGLDETQFEEWKERRSTLEP